MNPMVHLAGKYPKLFALCAVSIISLVAFANSLSNDFHFDDWVGIVRNPTIRDLRNIPSYFTDPSTFALGSSREWRPILQTTYALNYSLGGLNPTVFRIFNLIVHVGTAFLIFLVVAEICGRFPAQARMDHPLAGIFTGLLAAVVFAVHTANDQAVNYIWSRSSVLAAFFYLAAFYCCLRGPFHSAPGERTLWHLNALVGFALGLGTKATAATLPAALLVYEIIFLNPAARNPVKLFFSEPKRIKKYLPLAILLMAYLAIRFALVPRIFIGHDVARGAVPPAAMVTPYSYLLTQFRAWVYYLGLFSWPHPLSVDFSGFGWSRSLGEPRVWLSLALVIAILFAAWWLRKAMPLITYFLFWFFITLLPESSFIPLADAVVGYRAYLPYVGLAVVLVLVSQTGWHWVWNRLTRKIKPQRFGCWSCYGMVICAMLLALTGATIDRNRDWRDDLTLWNDVLSKDARNPRAHMALGVHFLRHKDFEKSQEMLDKAVQYGPGISEAYALRGYLRASLNRKDEALSDFTTAINLDRRSPYPFAYRGDLYNRAGELDKALVDFQTAINLLPSFGDAYFGVAMVYLGKEDLTNATAACQKLVDVDPDDRRGYDCLGALLIEQNRLAEAIRVYQRATARFPANRELWASLGNAYRQSGMHSEAAHAFAKSSPLMEDVKGQLP